MRMKSGTPKTMRAGQFKLVHVKTQVAQEQRILLACRKLHRDTCKQVRSVQMS